MFVKIAIIVLVAFVAISRGDDVWTGLTAKWAMNVSDGFYTMPQTLDDALLDNWTEISDSTESNDIKALGYHGDPRIILLYSVSTNEVIGFQVSFLVSDIEEKKIPIDYAKNRAIIRKNLNGQDYFTSRAYFKQNETAGTREIWIREQGGLVNLQTDHDKVLSGGSYYLNKCVKRMGVHYYTITTTTDCGDIYPWLLVSVNSKIIGLGFLAIGGSSNAPTRTWFESLPTPAKTMRDTIPASPDCLVNSAVQFGYMIFHMYFINNPKDIECPAKYTARYTA